MGDQPGPVRQPVLAVGAVVVVADHLLLVTRVNPPAQGMWTIPGGRVEPGETMAEAVVREVGEETGLVVDCGPLLGWVERISRSHHFVIFDFRAVPAATAGLVEDPRHELALTAGDDAGAARWVGLDEIRHMSLVPGLLDFLTDHGIV